MFDDYYDELIESADSYVEDYEKVRRIPYATLRKLYSTDGRAYKAYLKDVAMRICRYFHIPADPESGNSHFWDLVVVINERVTKT